KVSLTASKMSMPKFDRSVTYNRFVAGSTDDVRGHERVARYRNDSDEMNRRLDIRLARLRAANRTGADAQCDDHHQTKGKAACHSQHHDRLPHEDVKARR